MAADTRSVAAVVRVSGRNSANGKSLLQTDDPDDDYLVALAREHGVEEIVSGDRHLMDAANVGVPVWNPRTTLTRLGLDA